MAKSAANHSSPLPARRIIYIMRHAKAEPGEGHDDYLRKLSPSGTAEAREVANTMALAGVEINRLVSSDAPRAVQTAQIMGDWMGIPQRRRVFMHSLYEASRADWLAVLRALPATCRQVLLVGHNPTLEELVRHLGPRAVDLPPGGMLALSHAGPWAEVGSRVAQWHWGCYPRRTAARMPRLPFAMREAEAMLDEGMVQPQNRELSWLSFNARVAQEAADKSHTLITRLKFIGIVSSNLDEFYRVRMGALVGGLPRHRDKRKNHALQELSRAVMARVRTMQAGLQEELDGILAELKSKHDVELVNETQLTAAQRRQARQFFEGNVRSLLPVLLQPGKEALQSFLNTERVFLALRLVDRRGRRRTAVVEIPTARVRRFVSLPIVDADGTEHPRYLWLDDLLRLCLPDYFRSFGYEMQTAHCFKVSRNAELAVGDADGKGDGRLADLVKMRDSNKIVRLLHDADIPEDVLTYLLRRLPLARGVNIVAGGRYHNHRDFMNFQLPAGMRGLRGMAAAEVKPVPVPAFAAVDRYFSAIERRDVLLHFPFHDFRHLVNLLREASLDESVRSISITIYRAARRSEVVEALRNAMYNGKKVTVMLETKARFDEENNLRWARVLGDAGAEVLAPRTDKKVHAKVCLIERRRHPDIAFFSTGNFNEDTAKHYCDEALITADPRLTKEAGMFFQLLHSGVPRHRFRHLLVSPVTMRAQLVELINREMTNAAAGKKAEICLKLNSLNDPGMTLLLHRAAAAGVHIKLVVRSIFSLNPELQQYAGRVQAVSIVDTLLEHARFFIFANGGDAQVYIASADMLTRNLDHRYELAVPVYDAALRRQIISIMQLQLSDNTKARLLNAAQDNALQGGGGKRIRAQRAITQLLG